MMDRWLTNKLGFVERLPSLLSQWICHKKKTMKITILWLTMGKVVSQSCYWGVAKLIHPLAQRKARHGNVIPPYTTGGRLDAHSDRKG
jgi:hypothetical protein